MTKKQCVAIEEEIDWDLELESIFDEDDIRITNKTDTLSEEQIKKLVKLLCKREENLIFKMCYVDLDSTRVINNGYISFEVMIYHEIQLGKRINPNKSGNILSAFNARMGIIYDKDKQTKIVAIDFLENIYKDKLLKQILMELKLS